MGKKKGAERTEGTAPQVPMQENPMFFSKKYTSG